MSKPITLCYKICYAKSFYSKNVCLAFVETLKVGSWKHIEHISVIMTFVQTTFVLVIFVHNRNISAVTDPILIKL